jgi:hypothetical protein
MNNARLAPAILAGVLLVGTPTAAHGAGMASDMRAPEAPAEAVRLHATHYGAVQPSVRFWIQLEARKLKVASPASLNVASVAAAARARFAGQRMAPGDLETLVVLVLIDASKQTEWEMRALAEKQRAALQARETLRELQARLDTQAADVAGKPDAAPCRPPACGDVGLGEAAAALRQTSSASRLALPTREPATVGELRAIKDAMRDKVEAISALGEAEARRLQAARDRLSMLVSALGEILVKASDTAQSVVQKLE